VGGAVPLITGVLSIGDMSTAVAVASCRFTGGADPDGDRGGGLAKLREQLFQDRPVAVRRHF
jgi:hypothetical protein